MKVRVYYNLHRKLWSIQSYTKGKGWRIVGHASELYLQNVTFRVSEAGRKRVLLQKRKNVHAYAIGTLTHVLGGKSVSDDWCEDDYGQCTINEHFVKDGEPAWVAISYNPYLGGNFTTPNGKAVNLSAMAIFKSDKSVFGLTSKGIEVYC